MELESTSKSPLSPVKDYNVPPDVNRSDTPVTDRHWYSGLALPQPFLYITYLTLALVFGIAALVVGVTGQDIATHPTPFWGLLPQFLVFVVLTKIALLIHFVMIPAFWRARARKLIGENFFDSSAKSGGGRKLVLEIGCNEGWVSAIFARAILARQQAGNDSDAIHSSLPIFIGYDEWSVWSRIPNSPAYFLSTLMNAGVPRECIVANRMDTTSKETKTTLPYASGSISLIICDFGLTELIPFSRVDRGTLFHELVRVLEPEGRIVAVDRGDGGKWGRKWWKGPIGGYQRILVEDMGWPQENAVVRWDRGLWYLAGVKPSGISGTV